MKRVLAALFLVVAALAHPAFAVEPDEMLKDPALEARARDISAHLRCLVCQNESIDESNADLAKDLRLLVRDRLKAGDTDDEVKDYLVARYGEFVLLQPRFSLHTALLYFGAPLVLLLGIVAIVLAYRRRAAAGDAPAPLSADEKAELDRLIETKRS